MQTLVQTNSFSISPAEASDMRACRMLLPACFLPTQAPELLVALDADKNLIGAAAIGWATVGDPPAFPTAMHVVPTWRRRGVGRALVKAAATALRGEAPAMRPWSSVTEASDAAAFCLACGFIAHHRVLHFVGEAERMETALAGYRERLEATGWIPPNARIVTLPEAPLSEVAHLAAREFHSSPAALMARLQGRAGTAFDPARSVVLLVDGAVMGAQLVSIAEDGIPEVDANVVSPKLRRGWANLLLTHEGTRVGVANGSRRFRFFCDERVTDTVKLARRSGAELVRTDLSMIRPVASA
jgi:GNAT superfamily N-acetyltransferase